jgi:DNA-binding transcriptional ArsR family regulator
MPAGTPRVGGARNATPRAGGAGNAAPRPSGAAADATDAVFAALSDGTRRSLYANLGERGEATATDLARDLPVTRQAVQKHLGTLASAGLVATRRAGREVLYRPTPAPMSEALAWMAEVGAQWDDRLAALERQLAGRAPHQPIG